MAINTIIILLAAWQTHVVAPPHACSRVPPVELEHEACDDHAARNLEGHPSNDIHLLPGVRVEGRVIQLLGIQQLLCLGAWGHDPHPITPGQ